ncbi:MAG: glucoamylase family protein, partial [Gemmatimonadaceae bacterium]
MAHELTTARSTLQDLHLTSFETEPTVEWFDWSQRLIAEHLAWMQQLATHWPYGKNTLEEPEPQQPFITLREAAASLPDAHDLVTRLEVIADRAYSYAMEMDFGYLYDTSRKLLTVGVNVSSRTFDGSHYDLLASEARLTSFVAIAKNDLPVDHWFRLGRTLTHAAGETALVSWSGSMFEYLMPLLVMRSFPHTALDATYRSAVRRHVSYGLERGVPWGVSESAYNVRDRHHTYQYRAFGVPDLALKRGLGRDLVIAPYATALAIMVDPDAALQNFAALERKGALGPYGFRDAIDFTRPLPEQRYALVYTYMAHHIGMSVIALTNALLGQRWQRRFHSDPMVRSADLLLHERVPRRLVMQEPQEVRPEAALPDPDLERSAVREVDTPDTPEPHVGLLGHLPYTIMVTHSGSGYSQYEGKAVTRWRSDATAGKTGQFCYLKQIGSARIWSAAHLPTCTPADWYRALLATDRVSFLRKDGAIETRTEVVVVPEDAAEVRRVTVVNNGDETCEIELTSYGEIVLAPADTDRTHPAFSNLFVETEWHEWCTAITATRRPRSPSDQSLWCVHVVDSGEDRVGDVTCETDRAHFIGRGRTVRDPAAMDADGPLSGTAGAVLDPIFALRTRVRLKPGRSTSVSFTTLIATSRERAFELAGRYHDSHTSQRALNLAWTSSQIELRELGTTPTESATFQELAGHVLFPKPALRSPPTELRRNRGSQDRLWANGISGDLPILLATIESSAGLPTLRQVFAAHRYWRRRGLLVDVVILNAQTATYLQELLAQITELMFTSNTSGSLDQPGGIFIRRRDQINSTDFLLLSSTARVHIPCDGRSLGRILKEAVAPTEEFQEESDLPDEPVRRQERSTPPSFTV